MVNYSSGDRDYPGDTKEEIKLAFRIFLLVQPLKEKHLNHTDTFRMAREILRNKD